MARILLVEDDESVLRLLRRFLNAEGHEVIEAHDGAEGLLAAPNADLVLLDIGLPVVDGLHVAQTLRRDHPTLPIIMVTGRTERETRLDGFGAGVDDYVTKPFDLLELGARIRAVLRRSGYRDEIHCGALRVDLPTRTAFLDGDPVPLSRREFDLLALLARHPNMVFSRERLLELVWGADYDGVDRTIDVRVAALRRKLNDSADDPRFIEAIRGIGYRFCGGT